MTDIPDYFSKMAKVQKNLLETVASNSPLIPDFKVSYIANIYNELQPIVSSTDYLADIYTDIFQNMQPVIPSTSFLNSETVHALSSIGISRIAMASMLDMSSYTNIIDHSALSAFYELNTDILEITKSIKLTAVNCMNYPNLELHSELVNIATSPVAQLDDYLASMELPTFQSMISQFPVTDITETDDDTVNPLPINIEVVTDPQSSETEQSNDSTKTHNNYESGNETTQNESSFLRDIEWHKEQFVSGILYGLVIPNIILFAHNQITRPVLIAIVDLAMKLINQYIKSIN